MQGIDWKALVAEFIGTFALIFIGAGAGVMSGIGIGNLVAVALAHGLVIVAFAYAYGHISGTHINPAVTIGVWLAGKIDAMKALLYIVAQLLGAIVAGFVVMWTVQGIPVPEGVTGTSALVLGATTLNTGLGITPFIGVVLEFITTFFLVNTVLNAAVSGKGGNMAGFAIGMTLTLSILFIGPLTGASLNPARTLGPAVAMGSQYPWSQVWVYLVGPIAGGLAAAALYRWFLEPKPEPAQSISAPAAAPRPAQARSQQNKKR
jgi:aquaporin Z